MLAHIYIYIFSSEKHAYFVQFYYTCMYVCMYVLCNINVNLHRIFTATMKAKT